MSNSLDELVDADVNKETNKFGYVTKTYVLPRIDPDNYQAEVPLLASKQERTANAIGSLACIVYIQESHPLNFVVLELGTRREFININEELKNDRYKGSKDCVNKSFLLLITTCCIAYYIIAAFHYAVRTLFYMHLRPHGVDRWSDESVDIPLECDEAVADYLHRFENDGQRALLSLMVELGFGKVK